MSDISSLLGYDIRGEELRAAAAHSRLVREARAGRRAKRGRRGLLDAIRDRVLGHREPAAGSPEQPKIPVGSRG